MFISSPGKGWQSHPGGSDVLPKFETLEIRLEKAHCVAYGWSKRTTIEEILEGLHLSKPPWIQSEGADTAFFTHHSNITNAALLGHDNLIQMPTGARRVKLETFCTKSRLNY